MTDTKRIGLNQDAISFFKIEPFPNNPNTRAFFHARAGDENFHWGIHIFNSSLINGIRFIPSTVVMLTLFQQAFENYLKALLYLKGIDVLQRFKTHTLNKLLKEVLKNYAQDPTLNLLNINSKYKKLLKDLGLNFQSFRYMEGCVMFRHSEEISDPSLKEFEDAITTIYMMLKSVYDAHSP